MPSKSPETTTLSSTAIHLLSAAYLSFTTVRQGSRRCIKLSLYSIWSRPITLLVGWLSRTHPSGPTNRPRKQRKDEYSVAIKIYYHLEQPAEAALMAIHPFWVDPPET
jgi:hypothetical protein